MIQGWSRIRWAVVGIAALGPLVVPAPVPEWKVVASLVMGAAAWLTVQSAWSWMRRDLERLVAAASDVVESETDHVVLPVTWPDLLPLANAIERTHGRVRLQMRLLEQQREDLAVHLTRTEERLRDPTAEARRQRIARIGNLEATLRVGEHTEPAALLDISLDTAVLGVKPEHADRLVPGMPVSLALEVEGRVHEVGDAQVLAPARGGLLDLREWVFRFDPPLRPSVLPAELAKALELRGAERIRPLGSNPVNGTLICELGRLPVDVVDVSATGLGIRTTLDAKRAGRLSTTFTIQLHLPAMGDVLILPVTLRNMAVRTEGVRMGLSFDREADAAALGRIRDWLDATRRALAA